MDSSLRLRVVLGAENAEKFILPSYPETVDDLIKEIMTRFKLTFDFRLQFEDPDFDGALCNLVNIEDLPSKATVKVVAKADLDTSSCSTDDSSILSDSTDSSDRNSGWPFHFVVPTFSYDVEHILREGNVAFTNEGKSQRITKDQKHVILECMAVQMYKHKAYPSSKQIAMAAEALVTKHPCLGERGSRTGYDGWKNSLSYKMGNYRTKLSRAGIKDVSINAGKRSRRRPEAEPSRANIKRPRRGEINFLPNYPSGENKTSLEAHRLEIIGEFQKVSSERDVPLIYLLMQKTFALRREEIINTNTPISELKNRWPALFCEPHLYKEFHLITNKNLQFTFFAALDECATKLLSLYRQRRSGPFGEKLSSLLLDYSEQDKNDVQKTRTAVLFGLPLYLKEDPSQIFRTCKEEELDGSKDGTVALVAVTGDAATPWSAQQVAIVLEDQIVSTHRCWVDALVILFGLIYALHLEYPQKVKGFFDFLQMILLNLDEGRMQLSPKLQTLKNELDNE
ncbi:unnamed protein product [Knipowitschia caucasica]